MEEDKTSGFRKEGFLCFLEDNGTTVSGFFEIVEINQAYVKIRTKGNIVIIPMNRVLKIKLKEEDKNE